MEWFELVLSVLAGLATAIPLVIKLIEYVSKTIKEKNWNIILSMVMDYMKVAEEKFENGADRKEWVLAMIEAASSAVNYDVDLVVISDLIDHLCAMAHVVNASDKAIQE